MSGAIPHPADRVPLALRPWAEAEGYLGPDWEWALVPEQDAVPLQDQDAYRWQGTLLKHIVTVDDIHYYAGRRYPLTRIYWTAFRLWWDDFDPADLMA